MKKHIVEIEVSDNVVSNDKLYIDGDLICDDLRQKGKFIEFLKSNNYQLIDSVKNNGVITNVYEQ